MNNNQKGDLVVEVGMLVRRPVQEVFNAFIDPSVTTRFWFTKSSGRLEAGQRMRWDWEMCGVGDTLVVKELEENRKILIEWDSDSSKVEWKFEPRGEYATWVQIRNWGFRGNDDEIVAQAIDSKGGYSLVLAGLKAFLEHGIVLNLITDHFPDACSASE